MKKGRFSEGQIMRIVQERETSGMKAGVCRRHGISEVTYVRWRLVYGRLDVSQLQRLKTLEGRYRQHYNNDPTVHSGIGHQRKSPRRSQGTRRRSF